MNIPRCIVSAFAALITLYMIAGPASAHSWYPRKCCSDRDCYLVQDDAVELQPTGYLIRDTGEVIPYAKTQLSPDGYFHRCSVRGAIQERTLCLFVPGAGS